MDFVHEPLEIRFGDGPAEQEALECVTTVRFEEFTLALRFDTFGNHVQIEVMRQTVDGPRDVPSDSPWSTSRTKL